MAQSGRSSGSRVVTLEDLSSVAPTLRLTLKNKASDLSSGQPKSAEVAQKIGRASTVVRSMFAEAESGMALQEGTDPQKTAENKAKLKDMFAKMHHKLEEQQWRLERDMDDLTPEQQEELLSYWGTVQDFFMDLFNWLKDTFDYVLDKIKQGFKIVKEAVQEMFKTVMGYVKVIFPS